jgi:hypothetical protein
MKKILFFLLILFPLFSGKASALDFPQSGVLASQGNIAGMDLAIPQLPMGITGEPVPMLASLSQDKGYWNFTIENTSEKPIQISVEIAQFDGLRKKLSGTNSTFKIKAGSKVSDKVLANNKSAACALILKSWK